MDVPHYDRHELQEKRSRFCVCVFVINEGEKLLKQLARMQPQASKIDIVIADGGSTDGSTETKRLADLGVNTLLVKRGPGKLGAQMRMAFAWALERGYEGVVVIDGNGKDGVEAIPRFVEKLDAGYDHVQGSRFIEGGVSENLPFSRWFGVKFIHAPMIGLASGFDYTDTTNGFRAYSRKLLEDPGVDLFRDRFSGYELHYYLAVQAARRGFQVCEIPVARRYPDKGPIPSKISPLRGNLNVMGRLLSVCLGRYDAPEAPGETTSASGKKRPMAWLWLSLAALVLALATGFLLYRIGGGAAPEFSELAVGRIAWRGETKTPDYWFAFGTILSFAGWLALLATLGRFVMIRLGEPAARALERLLGLCVLPAVFVAAQLPLNARRQTNLDPLYFAAGLILLVAAWHGCALIRARRATRDADWGQLAGASIWSTLLACFSAIVACMAVNRLSLGARFVLPQAKVETILSVSAILAVIAATALWLVLASRPNVLRRGLVWLLAAAQLCVPLGFVAVLPAPWHDGQAMFRGNPVGAPLAVLTLAFALAAWVDIARRVLRSRTGSLYGVISPFAVLSFLLCIKCGFFYGVEVRTDDFHWGETLLPYWLTEKFGAIPYWDYAPSRGLSNYLRGFMSALFFDGSAVATDATYGALSLLFLAMLVFSLKRVIGLFLTLLCLSLAPFTQHAQFVIIASLCLCLPLLFDRRHTYFLVVWFVLGTLNVLFEAAQGGIFVLATAPLGLYAAWRAYHEDRRRLLRWLGIAVGVFLLLMAVTPLGKMIFGAVRYVLEQGSLNTVSYGVPWRHSASADYALPYPFYEVLRTLFIGVACYAVALTLWGMFGKRGANRLSLIAFASSIALILIWFVPYAVGRIDAGVPSRLGYITMPALLLWLPILLRQHLGAKRLALAGLVTVAFAGIFARRLSLETFLSLPTQRFAVDPKTLADGAEWGMPNLGRRIAIEPGHRERLQKIKRVLDGVLQPGETYLDLTSRNAQYFYFGLPVPIEVGAVYNLCAVPQQLRAVDQLKADPPPVVLALADNIWLDGGRISMRAYHLYRYAALHYQPLLIDEMIFLMRPDRAPAFRRLLENEPPTLQPAETQNERWLNGVSVDKPIVIFPKSTIARMLRPGMILTFAAAGDKEIVRIQDFGNHFRVHFAGGPLNPRADGHPHAVAAPVEAALGATGEDGAWPEGQLLLWDMVFQTGDFRHVPISWGRSHRSLSDQMDEVAKIDAARILKVSDLETLGAFEYRMDGNDPYIVLDVEDLGLSGEDAGLLVFDFDCEKPGVKAMELFWKTADQAFAPERRLQFNVANGRVIVPLDPEPRWLLSPQLQRLRLDMRDAGGCKRFRLANLRLMRRLPVDSAADR